ncbi:hypothetical protein K4H28_03385 [Deefgea tanakiae]|uniref:Lipoprotein n=1 Tax=Deefgea tanakiae TaxID=2865840 RepID=A0ABX8Z7B3_9NEIS|nr:hypothetical protein [Deefgea tanakiae]QZA78472.1 hypothetical protein K4H28_03385 [Deefgea tanakiae]
MFKNSVSSKWFTRTAALVMTTLLAACGGSGIEISVRPTPTPPPLAKPWTGPTRFIVTQPETGPRSTTVDVAAADGSVVLDGVRRNFQADVGQVVGGQQLAFSAGQPWQEDPTKLSRSTLVFNGQRQHSFDYPDGKSQSVVGGGTVEQTLAVRDFIALCSPEKRYFLVNANAQNVNAEILPQLANKTLYSKNFSAQSCLAESGSVMEFNAFGNVTVRNTSTGATENISANNMQILANRGSVLTADRQGIRSLSIFSMNDGASRRLLIQEFVEYRADPSKNYIRMWY